MYRYKNFLSMRVLDSKGKNIGTVADIALNFKEAVVEGFSISGSSLLHGKKRIAYTKDVIYYGENMVVSLLNEAKPLTFHGIKGMEAIDICGNIIGVVEDLIFDDRFRIKGIIICPGVLKKIYEGKQVLLINEVIFGERQVLFYGRNELKFLSLRHSISGGQCHG